MRDFRGKQKRSLFLLLSAPAAILSDDGSRIQRRKNQSAVSFYPPSDNISITYLFYYFYYVNDTEHIFD